VNTVCVSDIFCFCQPYSKELLFSTRSKMKKSFFFFFIFFGKLFEMKKESSSTAKASEKAPERKRQREEFEKALESNGTFADLGLCPRVVEAMSRIPK
jgi:hypothetical protein